MRRSANIGLALIAALSLFSNSFASSKEDLAEARQLLEAQSNEIKKWIDQSGTPELKNASRSVRFIAEDSLFPAPRVGRYPGSAETYLIIPNQYRLLLVYFEELTMIGVRQPELRPCHQAYADYVRAMFVENRKRIFEKKTYQNIDAPEVFALTRTSVCKGLRENYPFPQELRPVRDGLVAVGIRLTYFHELGHIARKHRSINERLLEQTDHPKDRERIFFEVMRRSREQELEADSWAVDQLVRMGVPAQYVFSTSFLSTLLASSGIDCSFEKDDSHPVALNRVERITSQIEISHRNVHGTDVPPVIRLSFRDVRALAAKARNKLGCN